MGESRSREKVVRRRIKKGSENVRGLSLSGVLLSLRDAVKSTFLEILVWPELSSLLLLDYLSSASFQH